MITQQKPSKQYVLDYIEQMIIENPTLKIVDLGCGKALNFLPLIKKYPTMQYVGIEPFKPSFTAAVKNVEQYKNAQIIHDFAYSAHVAEQFDIVVSFSVLEHVKNLESFINFAASLTAPNGRHIHLYDLGHSLHPSSLQERLHVWFCNNPILRHIAPPNKFTAYVHIDHVIALFKKAQLPVNNVTYHNCPNHVRTLKTISNAEVYTTVLQEIITFEQFLSAAFGGSQIAKETLFPAVCLWSKKQ